MQYKTFTMAKNKPACSKGGCESGLFFKYTLSFPNLTWTTWKTPGLLLRSETPEMYEGRSFCNEKQFDGQLDKIPNEKEASSLVKTTGGHSKINSFNTY